MTKDELIVNIEAMETFEPGNAMDPTISVQTKKELIGVLQDLDVPTHEPHVIQMNAMQELVAIAERKIDYLEDFVVRLARGEV